MKSDKLHIGISGKDGFLANELSRFLRAKKMDVKNYSRPQFDLNKTESLKLDESLDIFIHVAWLSDANASELNLNAVKKLRSECEEKNIQFIFISSFSAHEHALSVYGKTKLNAENLLDSRNCAIIKPGLIIGPGGLFAKMYKNVIDSNLQLIPGNGLAPLQIISVENVCESILNLCENFKPGIYYLAHPTTYTLKSVQQEICLHRNRKFRPISIPIFFVEFVSSVATLLNIRLSFSKENLLGLKSLRSFDTEESLKKLNIVPLDFKQSLQKYFGK